MRNQRQRFQGRLARRFCSTCQHIIFITNGDIRIVGQVPELDLAASDHGVGAVTVVVVVEATVVDHGR